MQIYVKILVLAIIQAAAELLPVSSSAHVILAEKLMGLDPSSPAMVFVLIMLHTGTMFAVIVYFWKRWKAQFFAEQRPAGSGRRFLVSALLATITTGLLGLALQYLIEHVVMERLLGQPKGEVEQLFKSLPLIGAALVAAGLLILLSSLFGQSNSNRQLTPARALWIGMVQALCLPFRGFSRSGATISVGLMCGLPRRLAEDFSFALAVLLTPPVLVRQIWKLLHSPEVADAHLFDLLAPALLGMGFSFLAGLVALRVLSRLLEGGRWSYFGIYCLVFAGVMFAAAWQGI
ncbi:MAG TPA: undecaprenyl-diphosphate phosphatase [Gemmataceae bacterium]|nr:undecaprenyl-diphosphate phosphatase [Gemmataceae bacterium]